LSSPRRPPPPTPAPYTTRFRSEPPPRPALGAHREHDPVDQVGRGERSLVRLLGLGVEQHAVPVGLGAAVRTAAHVLPGPAGAQESGRAHVCTPVTCKPPMPTSA